MIINQQIQGLSFNHIWKSSTPDQKVAPPLVNIENKWMANVSEVPALK